MAVFRRIGKIFKPFVNFPRWMGYDQLAKNAENIGEMLKDLRTPRLPLIKETFEEALQRYHLSEEDLKSRMKFSFWFSLFYLCFALMFLSYTLYMFWHGFIGTIIGLLITTLMLSLAYREHFWYFQMKTRRLGCTFKDWVYFLFRGVKK